MNIEAYTTDLEAMDDQRLIVEAYRVGIEANNARQELIQCTMAARAIDNVMLMRNGMAQALSALRHSTKTQA